MVGKSQYSATLANYPQNGTFKELLNWHLAWGTRPYCGTNEPNINTRWVKSKFAQLVHDEGFDIESAKRSLRYWTNDGVLPEEHDQDKIDKIYRELFGDDLNLQPWKIDLERALERSRLRKAARIAKREIIEPSSVPRPTAHFMGRDDDVDALAKLLSSPEGPRALLLQGGPGIGKTELTKAIANQDAVAFRFGERRYFVPLGTATSAASMQEAIAVAMGGDPKQDFAAVLQNLRASIALLILDNLETPWESFEQQQAVEQLMSEISAVNGVAILASFRGREAIGGPLWYEHEVMTLSPQLSSKLFVSIAGKGVQKDPYLADFVSALGGLPLAIDLVARRAHGRTSLLPLWREWQRIGVDFAKRRGHLEIALTSLTHSIELSMRSPRVAGDANALRMFGFLGHLPTGFRAKDRDALIGDGAYNAEECLLNSGVAIERDGRIDLLPPVREYARRYIHLTEEDVLGWVNFYLSMQDNELKNIIDIKYHQMDLANVYAAEIFSNYLISENNKQESYVIFQKTGLSIDKAKWLLNSGEVDWRICNYADAEKFAKEALSLFNINSDDYGKAESLYLLAQIELHRSNFQSALSLFERSCRYYKNTDEVDKRREVSCALYMSDLRDVIEEEEDPQNPITYPGWRYVIPRRRSL